MSNQVSGGASTNTAQSTSANTSATQASTASGSVSNTSLSSIQSCPQKKKANLKLHVKSKGTSLKPSSVIPEASIRIEGCGDYYGKALKDGTYSKKRIEAGKYKMKCYKPGYSTKKDVDIILSEGQDVDIEVILDECQRVQKHEVSFNSARTNSRVTVHVWERNAHCDLCNSNKTSFHFFSRMNIDIDGAPNCYGPAGILDVHGKPPLDNLGNAGDPPPLKDANNNIIHWPPGPPHYGKPKPNYNAPHNLWRWKGVAVDSHNLPLVQTNNDPFPNFYVSQGALANPNVPGEDNPKHWINSRNVNYFSLPLSMTNMCNKGDLAAVIIPSADVNSEYYKFKIKTLVFAILADRGGEGIGEGSIALGKALGGRERQTIESPVIFVVFPNTNVMGRLNWPQANESIDEQSRVNAQMHAIGLQLIGLQHWNEWGGKDDQGVFKTDGPEERINYCLSELCTLSIAYETELTLQPDILNPNDPDRMRTRTRIAVTEKVTLTAMGAQPPITWKVIKGQSKLNVLRGPVVYLTAHDISEETIVEVTDSSGCKDKLQFTVDCCFLITPAKLK